MAKRKHIEQMSTEEVIAEFKRTGGISVPFYPWRYAGMRSKLNSLVRKGVLKADRQKGYTIYSLTEEQKAAKSTHVI